MLVKNMRLMLTCEAGNLTKIEDPRLFAARHNLDLLTLMLTVVKDAALHAVWRTKSVRLRTVRLASARC
jgi:hypothetical protein